MLISHEMFPYSITVYKFIVGFKWNCISWTFQSQHWYPSPDLRKQFVLACHRCKRLRTQCISITEQMLSFSKEEEKHEYIWIAISPIPMSSLWSKLVKCTLCLTRTCIVAMHWTDVGEHPCQGLWWLQSIKVFSNSLNKPATYFSVHAHRKLVYQGSG